ncbi:MULTISPECIES: protein translocase subunit SecF [Dietzia]|uniref:Protein-export membrane protein SecF n=1 Tax=Dietzia cinnamea TaxID=321318 RepID=A0A4R3ZYT8_9ACTN|nr:MULTISPECIES: protein translocase subunit SecF [Dietzia]AVM65375.1 protein translocase subunit SecF [Dietzia sp. oral taxon 368]MCT1712098.1 protein translocase subunit SecF [Dietzia cinnamea]MCT1864887.1 protein translocase subunit SecF [Dietzia cinnamea]MCT1884765.1 protein translocase subunit SecF [Dietzia cinnamea]MCT2030879.1 protein translocase subunit SecF [Dietzia cinnamea]
MSTPTSTATESGAPAGAPTGSLFTRLYTGTGAFGIVANRRKFYVLTVVIVAICLASIIFRGFSFGIDFTGGTKLSMPAGNHDQDRVAAVVEEAIGEEPQTVQVVGAGAARIVEVETRFLTSDEIRAAKNAMFEEFQPVTSDGVASVEAIGDSARSESWGGQVTKNALIALGVFLVIVFGYIAFRFEWQMATAAIVALLFDVVTTAGVYSIIGFEVTPATVIGLLTILGFSLYDTVIVFDKVEENTRGIRHTATRTYAEEANLGVNQTLMRSIHTTIIGVLPLLALVVIAVWILGVGTLLDLALVQMVGIVTGTFSSVFLATPLLVSLKNRDPDIRRQTAKVLARREKAEAIA